MVSINGTGECPYFLCYLYPVSSNYERIHFPLSMVICICGGIFNIINVIVLTRKELRTPINVLLTGLSAAQLLLAFNYLVLMSIEQMRKLCIAEVWAYNTASYLLLNHVTVAFGHTIAVAIFRYRALRWPVRANRSLNQIRPAVIASIVIWIIVPLMCIPVFMSSEVIEKFNEFGCQLDEMYDLGYLKDDFMLSLTFWVFGIGMKLIPSIVLSILIIALVRSLNRVERRRRALNLLNNTDDSTRPSPGPNRRLVQTQRTTRMLMAIMILCVIVEFPHGLLNLGIGIYGETFAVDVYDHLGEFMEMATLFYSSVSFMLYCAMSNDFKRTFRRLFLSSCKVCQRNDVCEPEQYRMTSL